MVLPKLQQSFGVLAPNLLVVLHAAHSRLDFLSPSIPPSRAVLDSLVRVVHAEKHTIGTDGVHDELERLRREMAAGGDPDVVLEVCIPSSTWQSVYITPRTRAW